jgi:CHAT domain-containing protein
VTNPILANEAVHIAGAFHLAGYQQVIASLWPVSDSTAETMAKEVYSHLTENGTKQPDINRSAQALHHATRRIRDRYPVTPTEWAGLTHTGP